MPRNVGVGRAEPDAVPGPVIVDGGFKEIETAADTLSARHSKRFGPDRAARNTCRLLHRGTNVRRGIVHRLLEKLERSHAGPRRFALLIAQPAFRRKHHMRHVAGVFMNPDLMAGGQRYPEFPFDRFLRSRQKTFAKLAVGTGS